MKRSLFKFIQNYQNNFQPRLLNKNHKRNNKQSFNIQNNHQKKYNINSNSQVEQDKVVIGANILINKAKYQLMARIKIIRIKIFINNNIMIQPEKLFLKK